MDQLAEVKRGEDAERLINNPLYIEAFDSVRQGILTAMRDSAFGDERTHHNLVIALQVLEKIDKHLTDVMKTGNMAKIQIENGFAGKLRAAVGF